MWLWILSALFLGLVWTTWWFLAPTEPGSPEIFPTWVAIAITVVVVLALVGLVVYRRVRAARAARALEKAIAQQAQEQVTTAKPEERAEVQALQKQMLDGIEAMKRSRLGDGSNALYALPWYAIVGPPGAGKTTALRHSGLNFPFLDSDGAGVKGVGGTRNCDWWFTNEAILLDTAGRYTTEADDRDEWMAFLGFLRQYRKHKPLNGVIVAVSVSELIDATEDEIEQVADRVRDRIDEMQEELRMVLPVYVMFTKCDLVAGFVEYFGDYKRSERGQAWGSTFALGEDKNQPGELFDREFDVLVESLHKRTIKRMNEDRPTRSQKEKIFQFPLEFAAIKRNLSDFMAAAFRPASPPANKKVKAIPTPVLRGFYFTSGTQEGKPLDRVVGAMGRAFGLRPAESEDDGQVESKSFFLKEVFTGIIFPDQDVAGRTEDEIKRVRWQRIAVAAAAFIVASVLMVPAIFSYLDNQDLIAKTDDISKEAAQIDWNDGRSAVPKIEQLDKLRTHLELLDQWRVEGAPIGMRWGMYQGDTLFEPALDQYIASLKWGFVEPVKAQLESELETATGARYLEDYNNLKTYLLLNDPIHLQDYDQWEVGRLTQVWATILRPNAQDISERDLRNKLVTHVAFYVDLMRRGVRGGPELNEPLVARVRDVLGRVGDSQRYYDQFVTILEDEKIDPAGPNTADNLKFPPITLNDLFQDRPDALTKLSSKQKRREGKWQKVRGPYTKLGHEAVLEKLVNGYEILEREKWVVPLSAEEEAQGDKIRQALERVRQDYDAQYIREWTEFFRDIDVAIPQNNIEAIEEFRVLSTPDWPYWRLLRALKENTQFYEDEDGAAAAATADGGVLDQIKRRVKRKVDSRLRTGPGGVDAIAGFGAGGPGGERQDPIPEKFKSMVEFAFPAAPDDKSPPPTAGLAEYVGQLEGLAAAMTIIEEGPGSADPTDATELFTTAVADTEKKVLGLDRFGQELMRDLLMNPLRQSYKAMVKSAGGAASGLWEVEVWPAYRDTIRGRYPFNSASRRDASYEDVVGFLAPNEGTLWGFYGTYLKGYHRQVGHKFIPATALNGSPRPARPFTPFNPQMYSCLERMDEITDALFPRGSAEPKLQFRVNLTTVSPIVSEIEFEIDGQVRLYRNEKEFWHSFTWPGPDAPLSGAAIRIRGAGGLDEVIERDGPWGLWRLLDSGRHGAVKDNDKTFVVEWQMSAPPVVVRMEMKPTRSNHPFPYSFFRDTNCPPSIGDTFGPG